MEPRASHLAVLEALATYRLLTAEQLLRVGVAKNKSHLYSLLRELHPSKECERQAGEAEPSLPRRRGLLIGCLGFGNERGRGSRARVWHLTRAGAVKLAELQGALEPVFVPAKIEPYASEYEHRTHTIDCHIALRRFAEQADFRLDFVRTYFGRGDERYGTRIGYLLDEREATIVPDMVFGLTSAHGISRLFAFELYEGRRTLRAVERLSAYADVIHQEALEKVFGFGDGAAQVIAVFDTPAGERLVRNELTQEKGFISSGFARYFFFKTIDEVTSNFLNDWRQVGKVSTVTLF